jgi:AcrR family transcriptional regulator
VARTTVDPSIRRRVISTARRLTAGQPHAPISRIAAEAGVSRATFYRYFGSRAALLVELDAAPMPDSRERILQAAAEMLQRRPWASIGMDELATSAGVSRATLYRLYSGKAHLLGALIERFAPFEAVLSILDAHGDEPPQVVVPQLAQAIVRSVEPRLGVIRALLMETTSGSADNLPGIRPVLQRTLGAFTAYLQAQMDAGRLRPMPPLLALQTVVGPITLHLLTRPVAGQVIGLEMSADEAAEHMSSAILEGLLP